MAHTRALMLIGFILLLTSCGGDKGSLPGAGDTGIPALLTEALGPLPVASHAATALQYIDGDAYELEGEGVSAQTPTAVLDASGLSCSWARYVYGVPADTTVNSLAIDVQDVASEFWVALADYAGGSWQWLGPYSDDATLMPAGGWDDYVSPTDNLYWVVAAAADNSLRILGCTVDYQPAAGLTFYVPPAGQHTAATGPASNPQLVHMPAGLATAEEGAPVIFYTADDDGNPNTFITYYDGTTWTQRLLVDDGPRLTHVVVRPDPTSTLVPFLLAALNESLDEVALLWVYDNMSVDPSDDTLGSHVDPEGELTMLAMDCLDSDEYCVAQVRRDGEDSAIRAYWDDHWATVKSQYNHSLPGEEVAGLDVAFGASAYPNNVVVAYSHGTVDTTDIVLLDFGITLATPEWTTENIDYNAPLSLDLGVSPTGDLQLLMISGRDFNLVMPPPPLPPVIDITATLYYDVVLGTWLGSEWDYDPLFESALSFNILEGTVDVDLGVDISWAGNGAFSMSHVDGTVELDLSDGFEITGGTLTNNSEYWMKLGGAFGQTDIFTGDAGLLFDWRENAAGGFSCAYIKAESVDIEDVLGGNVSTAGELLYWSPGP